MKKLFCLVLAAMLLTGITVPAFAADAANTRLEAVTRKVKETLSLDTSPYDTFYGDVYEDGLISRWNLSWSGEAGSLTIQADEAGTILSYNRYDKSSDSVFYPYPRYFAPSLPKGEEALARAAAQQFLGRVLRAGVESVVLEPDQSRSLGATQFYYRGTILLNGLPSPLSYRVTVQASDYAIVNFSRDSQLAKYLGGIPSAVPGVSQAAAGEQLRSTLKLRLEYVLPENGSKTALLRYLPESTDQYLVDAQTGELVNLSQLYQAIRESGDYGLDKTAALTEAGGSASGPLTGAEQEGIAQLEGVLSKEELSALLDRIPQLGLSRYALSSATYSINQTTGQVFCRLLFVRQTDDGLWRRYVYVDAKTGQLQSVSSSMPYLQEKEDALLTVTPQQAQAKARQFLSAYYPEDYAHLALYDQAEMVSFDSGLTANFRFMQQENGYFYPGNYYYLSIDGTDGSISSFQYHFDREVSFDSPQGMIDTKAALDAYFATFDIPLSYQAVPQRLDPNTPEYRPLISMGYSYLFSYRLAYALQQSASGQLLGIDAKTGKPVFVDNTYYNSPITYSDLSGHWVEKQAQTLAQYRVGWLGGALRPNQELTQLDLLCLLVSTNGYLYDPADEKGADQVYDTAYAMNLLTSAQRNDNAPVPRGELVKLLLNAGGYREVAQLKGIFRCNYRDEASIPQEYYSYAALAQGLGLVGGDGAGNFAPLRISTRAEAVTMLYRLMSR